MKVKLNEVINSTSSFQKLSTTDMPGKLAYTVARNIRKLEIEIKSFDDARNTLFAKYGEDVEEKNIKTEEVKKFKRIKKENIEQFQKEVNEILEKEVDVDIWKIKVVELEKVNLPPTLLLNVNFMIEE
jgi:vacuolar-type H+-ATPase subunit I/STV1